MNRCDVAIVGAGHAGVECALALRAAGFEGTVTLHGAESGLPYDRPPLSKALLAGTRSVEQITLKGEPIYAQHRIERIAGDRVVALDAAACTLRVASGAEWRFQQVVLATGARPRQLPGLSGEGVHSIRSLTDVAALRSLLQPGSRLLVAGAGYLGLEAACTAAGLGVQVTVLERAGSILPGRVSPGSAARLLDLHRGLGLQVLTDCAITGWQREADGWCAVLDDGRRFTAPNVLVAVGAEPDAVLAEQAGLVCEDGIWVDQDCRTSMAHVFAIGDCAAAMRAECGRRLRLESVNNALSQAHAAAAAIVGKTRPASRPPTFWSEQAGRRLQMAGLLDPGLPVEDILTETARGWVVERRQAGVLRAIEAVDSPVDFMQGVRRIALPVAAAAS